MKIPEIQPFQFIRGTAFSERVQLANKVNEIIDGINQIGDIPDLQAEIDSINTTIAQIQEEIASTDTEISAIQSQVNTVIQEVNGLLSEVVNEIVVDSPGYGQVRVKLIHEDESETASNALQIPVIQDGGITLISGTTDRSFKIQYITMDGVTHTTNDFVIPEGGGTDITVTSISILQGDTPNDIKFQVGLSDGSMIQSNSYPIPQAAITPATTSQIGGIKVGTNLSVTADGTLSVDMTEINTAAVASTVMFTADASKVTLHADSLAGSEFTKDIPQASQGGAGTIDQESYAKITATEAKVNALAPSVSVNAEADPPTITVRINGKNSTANLPTGGGSGWEELNVNSLPSDFQEGDIILVISMESVDDANPSSWTTALDSSRYNVDSSVSVYHSHLFTIPPADYSSLDDLKCTGKNLNGGSIQFAGISSLRGVNSWNEPNGYLFSLQTLAFNGVSAVSHTKVIYKSIANQYVKRILRMRV